MVWKRAQTQAQEVETVTPPAFMWPPSRPPTEGSNSAVNRSIQGFCIGECYIRGPQGGVKGHTVCVRPGGFMHRASLQGNKGKQISKHTHTHRKIHQHLRAREEERSQVDFYFILDFYFYFTHEITSENARH